jgi:hypothetical protein
MFNSFEKPFRLQIESPGYAQGGEDAGGIA